MGPRRRLSSLPRASPGAARQRRGCRSRAGCPPSAGPEWCPPPRTPHALHTQEARQAGQARRPLTHAAIAAARGTGGWLVGWAGRASCCWLPVRGAGSATERCGREERAPAARRRDSTSQAGREMSASRMGCASSCSTLVGGRGASAAPPSGAPSSAAGAAASAAASPPSPALLLRAPHAPPLEARRCAPWPRGGVASALLLLLPSPELASAAG